MAVEISGVVSAPSKLQTDPLRNTVSLDNAFVLIESHPRSQIRWRMPAHRPRY